MVIQFWIQEYYALRCLRPLIFFKKKAGEVLVPAVTRIMILNILFKAARKQNQPGCLNSANKDLLIARRLWAVFSWWEGS